MGLNDCLLFIPFLSCARWEGAGIPKGSGAGRYRFIGLVSSAIMVFLDNRRACASADIANLACMTSRV